MSKDDRFLVVGLEGRARFILDDPSEAYLWKGLEETGRASVQPINRASKLVSRDMYNFAQVRAPNPFGIFSRRTFFC